MRGNIRILHNSMCGWMGKLPPFQEFPGSSVADPTGPFQKLRDEDRLLGLVNARRPAAEEKR